MIRILIDIALDLRFSISIGIKDCYLLRDNFSSLHGSIKDWTHDIRSDFFENGPIIPDHQTAVHLRTINMFLVSFRCDKELLFVVLFNNFYKMHACFLCLFYF